MERDDWKTLISCLLWIFFVGFVSYTTHAEMEERRAVSEARYRAFMADCKEQKNHIYNCILMYNRSN